MNQHMKTYGVVINMDYAHQPVTTCQEIWHKIAENMLNEEFHIEKRMFIITSYSSKEKIHDKVNNILASVNNEMSSHENTVYHYLQDFLTVDMTDYVDLRFPNTKHSIELHEDVMDEIVLN